LHALRAIAIALVLALALLIGTAKAEIPRNGLVGEWHFDGMRRIRAGMGMMDDIRHRFC